jgi:hypothetical protein
VSGFAEDSLHRNGLCGPRLAKPVAPDELERAMVAVLDTR